MERSDLFSNNEIIFFPVFFFPKGTFHLHLGVGIISGSIWGSVRGRGSFRGLYRTLSRDALLLAQHIAKITGFERFDEFGDVFFASRRAFSCLRSIASVLQNKEYAEVLVMVLCSSSAMGLEKLRKYKVHVPDSLIKPSFHMSGKSQTIGDSTVSRPSQTLPTYENWKSYTSPIVWDGRRRIGKIGSVSIFPMRPRFLRWSAIIPDI